MKVAEKKVFLCAYGDEKRNERGIVELVVDAQNKKLRKERVLQLEGKCNLVIHKKDRLYLSIKKENGSFIEVWNALTFELEQSWTAPYFYSYGQIVDNLFLLASYESGVDSVFDLNSGCFTAHAVHHRDDFVGKGKSHYIQQLSDGQIVGIENGLGQLILYENMQLDVKRIIEFPPINIRLLSVHPNGKRAYLNTEFSNELIVLDTSDWHILERFMMVNHEGWYSGGNAISKDGHHVFVSIRGEDTIVVFEQDEKMKLHEKCRLKCGQIPRDLYVMEDCLLVSCTNSNTVELFDISTSAFRKCDELSVCQPITFEMKGNHEAS